MCGRYYIPDEDELIEIREITNEVNRRHKDADVPEVKTGEIYPTNIVPIITHGGPCAMKWGFRRFDGKGQVINARSETLLEKAMFKKPAMENRCLVPAAYYFEWETHGKNKVKYRLRPSGNAPLYMAGISRQEKDEALPVFSIITRAAALGIAHIHDRMPVILGAEARKEWLSQGAAVMDVLGRALQDMEYQPDEPVQVSLI